MVCAKLFFSWDNGLGLEVDTRVVVQRGHLPNSLDLVEVGYLSLRWCASRQRVDLFFVRRGLPRVKPGFCWRGGIRGFD